MAQINPCIHYNGNAEDAFTFYKSVFGGDFATVSRFKDLAFEDNIVSEVEANKIMHIALPIGNRDILMGSDAPLALGRHNEYDIKQNFHKCRKQRRSRQTI